ncbi:glucokinase [Methylopila capsulata]|uniref:Glucokinase n=1 Tax=Methylopila capsulata TaxID=61654 RepID=A0A9W6IVL1_9HYPH|nr:glucokinase [Methylopila capsulata]MBM7853381.1 glucokinase [Methylopila capsulata]GLK57406.1 glucokinase [Methylopila capsulata]
MTLLVGDIGGTNSRFGLVAQGDLRPDGVRTIRNDDHSSFEEAVAAYLDGAAERPKRAAFALAGPVAGRAAKLTNRDWPIDADALQTRLGLDHVALLNDFVAQASALPHFQAGETTPIGDVAPSNAASKAALGPGTGLGVAGLLLTDGAWLPVPSEGGHIELAAVDAREFAIFALIRRGFGRISAEHVLSGPGLRRLHEALAAVEGAAPPDLEPAEIVAQAEAGDASAAEAVALFLRLLARFAGDVALTFGAQGGVYLCGGVAPKLLGLLDVAAFRAAFEAKRPHEALMRKTATVVVTSEVAGLIGCAAAVRSDRAA